jgi:hypothetical protein
VPDTTYAVRRVSVASALRVGLAVGPAVALGPAILLAALLSQLLHQADRLLGGLRPLELNALGQPIARLDWLAVFGLLDIAQLTGRLAALGWLTFLGLTLLLTLVGSLIVALAFLLGAATYNAASAITGGLEVGLAPPAKTPARPPGTAGKRRPPRAFRWGRIRGRRL